LEPWKGKPLEIDVEKCYTRYAPFVLRRCRQLLKNEEEALDAMQETFVKLMRYKTRLEPTALSGLLQKIATNVCLNIVRTRHYKTRFAHPDTLLEIASDDDTEKKVWVSDIIDRLFANEKDTTRLIAVYHFVDGMTYDEIAGETGLSVSGIRKRLRVLKERALSIGGEE
jgi:RNA polymerase sigma factor (sigma-70 family)